MASGGFINTDKISDETHDIVLSDEIIDFLCSVCKRKDRNREAERYCVDCNDYYCLSCVKVHEDVPSMTRHQILIKSQFQQGNITAPPMAPTERCEKHVRKLVDMYCRNHDNVCCCVCLQVEHRLCEDIHYIPEFVQNNANASATVHVQDKIDSALTTFSTQEKSYQSEKQQLLTRKTNLLENIKQFREEINSRLDELEQNSVLEIENQIKARTDNLEEMINQLKSDIVRLKSAQDNIATAGNNIPQVFVSSKIGSNIAKKVEHVKNENKIPNQTDVSDFKGDGRIISLLQEMKALGITRLQSTQEAKGPTNSRVPSKVTPKLKHTTARNATTKQTTPRNATTKQTTPKTATTKQKTPRNATTKQTTARNVTTASNATAKQTTSDNATSKQTTAGNTTSKQTTAGNATSKQTTAGNATSKHTTAGNATSQQTTAGNATTEQTTAGNATTEQTTAENATSKQTTAGNATTEQTSAGNATTEQTSAGNATTEQTTAYNATHEQTAAGNATTEQTSAGNSTPGQTSAGNATTEQKTSGNATSQQTTAGNATTEQKTAGNATTEQTTASKATIEQTTASKATIEQTTASKATIEQITARNNKQKKYHLLKIKNKKTVSTKHCSDWHHTNIHGISSCCITANKIIILCDYGNKKLKCLHEWVSTEVYYCHLPGSPWQVCLIDDFTVAVSLGNSKEINFFTLQHFPIVTKTKTIKTSHHCYGLAYSSGNLYISDKGSSIYIYNEESGRKLKQFKNDLFRGPSLMNKWFDVSLKSLAISEEGSTIYVTHLTNGLLMFDNNGEYIKGYNGEHLQNAFGCHCLSGNQGLLVCGMDSNNVLQFTPNCELVGEVMMSGGGQKIKLVCCNQQMSTMVVYRSNTNHIDIYDLEESTN